MKAFARHGVISGPRSVCRHCGESIVEVPEIGWVTTGLAETYDLCAGDSFANHLPRARERRAPTVRI